MHRTQQIITVTLLTIVTCFSVQAAEYQVKMLNNGADGTMVFEPGYLKVAVGDTVKFIPVDAGHDSVSEFTPEGSTSWKGDNSKEVTATLDKEGVYIYLCTPHTVMAMVGVIQVGNATNLTEAKDAAKSISAKFMLNKDRLDKYLAQVN